VWMAWVSGPGVKGVGSWYWHMDAPSRKLWAGHLARGWERNPMTERKSPPWTAKELALLGTMPDPELARRLGRTRASVKLKRGGQRGRFVVLAYGRPIAEGVGGSFGTRLGEKSDD
jgi:trehalose utilization protein